MEKNMTEGSPALLIFTFSIPLLVGNLLQQTYNIIDAAIVGRTLGTNALAAVGASSSIQFLVLGGCIGICCGFGIPIAQRFGAQDREGLKRYVFNSAVLTAIFAVLLTALTAFLCHRILHLLSTPDDIYADAYRYLFIIFLGIPCTLLYNLTSSMLRSIGDSKTPFYCLAFSAILNIFLDLFCILVLKLGVAGAAIATIASQGLSGLLCLVIIIRKVPSLHPSGQQCRVNKDCVRTLLIMGIPMGLQYSITAIGSMVMQSANNGLGSVYVSGFTAGMKIKQFMMCPFDAFSTGLSVYCSQNLGARKFDRIYKGIRQGLVMTICYGLFAGLIMIFFGRPLSMLFINDGNTAVLDASAKYLRYMGYCYWMLGILNPMRMTTQGIGYSTRAIFSGVTEMFARILVSVFLVPLWGFSAICVADQSAWCTACFYIVPTCLYCLKKCQSADRQ